MKHNKCWYSEFKEKKNIKAKHHQQKKKELEKTQKSLRICLLISTPYSGQVMQHDDDFDDVR